MGTENYSIMHGGFLKPLSMGRQRFQMDDRANFTKKAVRIREEGVDNFKGSTT